MSENERRSRAEIEQTVASVFESVGYEVSQSVGSQPGEVDWFARPKTGLERPTTYWKVWDTCPAVLDDALIELEETRKGKGADRALAVMDGVLPVGYAADLQGRPSNAITLHRLIIELRGFADKVREQKIRYEAENEPNQLLPRRGRSKGGEVSDAVAYVKTWLQHGDGKTLAILAPQYSGRSSVINRVAYELALEFDKDPENVIPLVLESSSPSAYAFAPAFYRRGARTIQLMDVEGEGVDDKRSGVDSVLELIEPTYSEIEEWFQAQSLAPEVIELLFSARDEVVRVHGVESCNSPEFLTLPRCFMPSTRLTTASLPLRTRENIGEFHRSPP